MRKNNVVGDVFGKLVLKSTYKKNARTWWLCECSCGSEVNTDLSRLRSGVTSQCKGCGVKSSAKTRTKHGMTKTKEYRTWVHLKDRCINPNSSSRKHYLDKGITFCDEWLIFDNFFYDMGLSPTAEHSIDRIDNTKGYSKDNCRWATKLEQMNNMSTNKVITYKGETKTLADWCRYLGVNYSMVKCRLHSGLYTIAQSFELPSGAGLHKFNYITPDGDFKSMDAMAKFYKSHQMTIRKMLDSDEYPRWIRVPNH
tara:strand:+ start:172 stop:933 length:762 start_codon:yes stop_codon:yes gene_type:complete